MQALGEQDGLGRPGARDQDGELLAAVAVGALAVAQGAASTVTSPVGVTWDQSAISL